LIVPDGVSGAGLVGMRSIVLSSTASRNAV
jgi:hypothetical protein